jgi:hypothetical protein
MCRDRDDLEATHFGGQAVQEGEWVDFPPSPEEPGRVPNRIGRSVVLAPTHLAETGKPAHMEALVTGGQSDAPASKPRSRIRLIALAAVAAAALTTAGYFGSEWWTTGRFVVSTDDAYVGADTTTLATKISMSPRSRLTTTSRSIPAT